MAHGICRRTKVMATGRRNRRATPLKYAEDWIYKDEDPPGFSVQLFKNKGRGVITTVNREKGDFLLVYNGEIISAEEGEMREETDGGSGFRFFYKAKGKHLCVDATKETQSLCRLVNHGYKKERNAVMKTVQDKLCLFSLRDISVGEEILYDYGIKELPWEKPLQSLTYTKVEQNKSLKNQPFTLFMKNEQDEGSNHPDTLEPENFHGPDLCDSEVSNHSEQYVVDAVQCYEKEDEEEEQYEGSNHPDTLEPENFHGPDLCDSEVSNHSEQYVVDAVQCYEKEDEEEEQYEGSNHPDTLEPENFHGPDLCDSEVSNHSEQYVVDAVQCYEKEDEEEEQDEGSNHPDTLEPENFHGPDLCDSEVSNHSEQYVVDAVQCYEKEDEEEEQDEGSNHPDTLEPENFHGPDLCDSEVSNHSEQYVLDAVQCYEKEDEEEEQDEGSKAVKCCDKVDHSSGKCWGSVGALANGGEVIQMCSTVFSIGSARTDDYVVETAAKHEVFIHASQYEEIYLICSTTNTIQPLTDNTIFEVGGLALIWRANKEQDEGSNHPDTLEPENFHGPDLCDLEVSNHSEQYVVDAVQCYEKEDEEEEQDEGSNHPDTLEPENFHGPDLCDSEVSNHSEQYVVDAVQCYEKEDEEEGQEGNIPMEFKVTRDDTGFRLVQCDQQEEGLLNRMDGFVPDSDSGPESDVVPYPMLEPVIVASADSTTSLQTGGKQQKKLKVVAVRSKEDRAGKVDYSKRHACLFCGKLDPKISRHLCSKVHSSEELIARLPPVSKPGSQLQTKRENMLDALRNEGDFIYNIGILTSGKNQRNGIIVAKRPPEGTHCADDYLPCKYCLRFYIKTELWRHGLKCPFKPEPADKSDTSNEKESARFIKSSKMLLRGAGVYLKHGDTPPQNDEFYTYVRGALQNDSIGRSCKNDPAIIQYGKTEFERLGRRRANEVRYRMRLLERVKEEVMRLCQSDCSVTSLESLLTPDRFPSFVQAVRAVVGIAEERSLNGVIMFDKPELARKVGQMLKKFAEICEGRFVVNGNREARQCVKDFLFLYSTQWKTSINSIAHQTSVEKKFNKKDALPLTEDVQTVQQHLDKEIVVKCEKLKKSPSAQGWQDFAKVLLTKITLFNFRRGNECAAMQVVKFQQRNNWKIDNQEIYQSLQSFEQELAQRMDLVEVMGKRNRKVPVLLTPPMKAGIESLIQFRDVCGVHPGNIYVFAKGQKSFIEGSEALRCVLEQVQGLKRPELLRFPSMRKYLATVIQVFGMPENEVQEVARHMGHELSVHRQFYRLQDDVIELAKISKLLLAVESGKAHQFKGISLDDLDFNDIPEVVEGENVEIPLDSDTHQKPVEEADIPEKVEEENVEIPLDRDTYQHPVEDAVRSKRTRLYEDKYSFNESDGDLDNNDGSTVSSESDEEPVAKRNKTEKRKWTSDEKDALKPLVLKSFNERKPPKKSNVVELVNKNSILKKMKVPWLSVKHQVWAMAQQMIKLAK